MIKLIPIILAFAFIPFTSGDTKTILETKSSSNHSHSSELSDLPNKQVTSSSFSSLEADVTDGDYFYCGNYGPFNPNDKNPVQITFTYRLASIGGSHFAERVRLFKDGQVVYASKKATFNYSSGTTKDVTFSINFHDYLTEDGLELRFELMFATTDSVVKSHSITFYPPKSETISYLEYKHKIYESRCVGFYADGRGFCELKDTFDFTKFGDYVDNDYYYRLEIDRNKFYFSNTYPLKFDSVYLRFYDDELLFPNIFQRYKNQISLPLKLLQNNEEVRFQFKDMFYVDKKTLKVSDSYRQGYYYSSSFYFPINSQAVFNSKTLTIDIRGLGLNKINTSITLKYEVNRLLVGPGSNGEYFIRGGVN